MEGVNHMDEQTTKQALQEEHILTNKDILWLLKQMSAEWSTFILPPRKDRRYFQYHKNGDASVHGKLKAHF